MHILISSQTYPTPKSQLSAFLAVLAEELVRQGVEVTVLAPQSLTTCWRHKIPLCPQRYKTKVTTPDGIKEITVLRPYSFTFGRGKLYRLSQKIDKYVVSRTAENVGEKFDIIYSHFWWSAENIVDYAANNSIPLFVATGEHVIDINKYLSGERIEFIKDNTKGVICVSSKNLHESVSCGLTDGGNTVILPNAVNPKVFCKIDKKTVREKLGFPQDCFIIAFCGRFGVRKGSGRVAAAIKMLKDENIKSLFIGKALSETEEEPECPGILFKGHLPHDVLPIYLNAADIFVLPTLAEGCSNAIVEAMACGLPVVSSNLPFNHDICTVGNSILIDPQDVIAIASAIRRVMNFEIRKLLSEGALKTAANLTIEKRVKEIRCFMSSKVIIEK